MLQALLVDRFQLRFHRETKEMPVYDILITPPERAGRDETNRAIVYAVVDQLGLKLESTKDPVEILGVDRVDKPSAD